MVWGKAGSTTLSSTGDNITVSDMTASESNVIMLHKINSGNVNPLLTFNSDSGSNYTWRYSSNGGTDSTVINGTKLEMAVTGSTPTLFTIFYSVNISAEEKLVIGHTVEQNTAGAGNTPQRMEVAGKWTNTSSQITALNFGNDAAGDYAVDSNVSVLGSDITPAAAITFPTNVQAGSRAEITDTRKMYAKGVYGWSEFGTALMNDRGIFGGGNTSVSNVMDYITIATTGNATDFGDLSQARQHLCGVSSNTRGVFCGGNNGSSVNTMDYITIAILGNATDFGDITVSRYLSAGVSSTTRGVICGGTTGIVSNVMDYITISTTGNATDFGDITVARYALVGVDSDTRGVMAGGYSGSVKNTMDYITIATTGNATDFGDLTRAAYVPAGVSNDTRGVFMGGSTNGGSTGYDVIDYITIATTGNATDFGDLTVGRQAGAGVSSSTRGVVGGGENSINSMEYITIQTTGNATDFGDLTVGRQYLGGVDDS